MSMGTDHSVFTSEIAGPITLPGIAQDLRAVAFE